MYYDIFNGDADGIIALLQLRLSNPKESQLVTGVKRDIKLLEKVTTTAQDELTVLDISMAKNSQALQTALATGATVFYADHHQSGDIPQHSNLSAHIDLDANSCTALIIDAYLKGKYHHWAITAAYGDNLIAKADQLADSAGLSQQQKQQLKELGTLINYNGYGEKIEDLHFHPAALYQALLKYPSPFDVIADKSSPYYQLQSAYQDDMDGVLSLLPQYESDKLKLYELTDSASSRRISGVFGNYLANQCPDLAHAVLTLNNNGTYTVSLRAPLNDKKGAGTICASFATGGGREAAAGINALPKQDVERFIQLVEESY
jgi:hypothetical protein